MAISTLPAPRITRSHGRSASKVNEQHRQPEESDQPEQLEQERYQSRLQMKKRKWQSVERLYHAPPHSARKRKTPAIEHKEGGEAEIEVEEEESTNITTKTTVNTRYEEEEGGQSSTTTIALNISVQHVEETAESSCHMQVQVIPAAVRDPCRTEKIRKMMEHLQGRNIRKKTIQQYAPHLVDWEVEYATT